ncbi:MAG: geranylgeranyl reductase family protein [Candidatus Thorarchaeota archaeon]
MLYDVIVVGAGPAGSIAAYKCARLGLRVLLIDKAVYPRDKPCGGGISVRSIEALKTAGIKIPSYLVEQEIFGLNLMGPDGIPFVLKCSRRLAYIVKRGRFDHFLAKEAVRTGAEFLDGCPLIQIKQFPDQIICQTKKGNFRGRLVIGADGAASTVGRLTGLRKPVKANEIGVAVEVDVPISERLWDAVLDPTLIIVWFLNIPYGYFWAFPRKQSLSVGVGGMADRLGNAPKLLRGLSKRFCKHFNIQPFTLQNIKGHMLPVFRKLIPLTSNRVLLIGDAAGFIDTFSGQGICYALESGLIAAHVAEQITRKNQKLPEALSNYSTLINRRFGEELRYSWTVARIIHGHLYGGLRAARFLKSIGSALFDLALGKIDYYQMKRNPISYLLKLFVYELQGRLMQSP